MDDLVLFESLLGELRGPHRHDLGIDVGFGAMDLYDAIARRARAILDESNGDSPWLPDEVDLATIRVLSEAILKRHYAPEFETVTGRSFEDVRAIQTKAVAMVRQRRGGAGSTTVMIADKHFQFPARIIRQGAGRSSLLIAVPDATSWARVYRHIQNAETYRDETFAILKKFARPEDLIVEFDADSYFDLDHQALSRARHGLTPPSSTQADGSPDH